MSRTEIVSRGKSAFVDGFELFDVKLLNDIMLRVAMGGRGDKAPVLMVHGHPHTHVIWRKVAPALAKDRQVILVDLRGYGDSTKPESTPDHRPYSKREMARDLQLLLQSLGIEQCDFVGHDRGGRVGHRFALDWPELVRKAVFIDIAPTATMYERTDKEFASRYFWWFFLIQPEPFPEKLINFDPEYFLRHHIKGQLKIEGTLEENVFRRHASPLHLTYRVEYDTRGGRTNVIRTLRVRPAVTYYKLAALAEIGYGLAKLLQGGGACPERTGIYIYACYLAVCLGFLYCAEHCFERRRYVAHAQEIERRFAAGIPKEDLTKEKMRKRGIVKSIKKKG